MKPLRTKAGFKSEPLPTVGKGVGIPFLTLIRDIFLAEKGSQIVN
jgi:hypothetical protein